MPRSKAGKAIRISGPARRDLAQIGAYTRKEWGKRQKSAYLAGIKARFLDLRDTPGMGTDRRDMNEGLRSHPVGKHVIYYRETKRYLVIVRVLHQNMEPARHLGSEQETSR